METNDWREEDRREQSHSRRVYFVVLIISIGLAIVCARAKRALVSDSPDHPLVKIGGR